MNRSTLAIATLALLTPIIGAASITHAAVAERAELRAAADAPISVMSVSGRARVSRTPDFVDVIVGISTLDKTAGGAQAQSSYGMSKIVAATKALNLAGIELQTGQVDLGARYSDYSNDAERKIIGYAATMTMRVRTTDLTAVPRIIDAALGAGANRIDGVSFQIKEAIGAREEAIKLAAAAAKRKAAVLAEALDVRLVDIQSANESSSWAQPYMAQNVAQMGRGSVGGESDGSAIEPGQIEVWGDVSITYRIAPKN